VKVPKTKSKTDLEVGVAPTKQRRQRKLKSTILNYFPAYMQDAFFGRNVLDSSLVSNNNTNKDTTTDESVAAQSSPAGASGVDSPSKSLSLSQVTNFRFSFCETNFPIPTA
jgi:hypothetical protein